MQRSCSVARALSVPSFLLALVGAGGCPRGEATPHPCPGQLAPVEVQVASTAQEVLLTWDAHNRATAFRIERGSSADGPFETLGEVQTPTFVDDTLTSDARVFYKVHAVGEGCEAPAHAAHEAYGPAAAPTGLFAQAFSDVGVSISWDDAGDNTSAFVVEKRALGGMWQTADERGPAAAASNLGGFMPDSISELRVGASVPTSIEPSYSDPIEVLTFPRAVLDIVVEAIGPSSVRVTYANNNPNSTYVEVGKKRADDFFFTPFADVPADLNSFVDDSLEEWVFYRYQFIVHNAAGESEEIVVPAAAWLPPRLFWEGEPTLSDACVLTLDGSFQIDLGHGAELAEANGDATGVGAPPLTLNADQTGVDVDLGQAWEGVLDVTWSLTDTFGQTRGASRTVELAQGTPSATLSSGAPSAVLGADSGEGRQMLLPPEAFAQTGCDDACLGRRASVALGDAHTCVLDEEGGVQCAGAGGRLGRGSASTQADDALDSVCSDDACSGTFKQVELVVAGDAFSCALTMLGEVRCWGEGAQGQLGGPATASSPVLVLGNAVGLAAGGAHACALLGTGEVHCWGANDQGQLGRGATSASDTPGPVCASGSGGGCPALTGVTALGAGAAHTCAIVGAEGRVQCWGRGDDGQLGDGSGGAATAATLPVSVACGVVDDVRCTAGELAAITSLGLGEGFTCAGGEGQVLCWGRGDEGQLGDGLSTSSTTPVAVSAAADDLPLEGQVAVSAGASYACAQGSAATASCWGTLSATTSASRATPVHDDGLGGTGAVTEALTLAVGGGHACAVDLLARLRCAGSNVDGQLAAGDVGASSEAVVDGCAGAACAPFAGAALRVCAPMVATVLGGMDASDDP